MVLITASVPVDVNRIGCQRNVGTSWQCRSRRTSWQVVRIDITELQGIPNTAQILRAVMGTSRLSQPVRGNLER